MSSPQAIDLYRVQRQLVWEISYWERLTKPRNISKPTMLDALRILQWERVSLLWYVLDFNKDKKAMDRAQVWMEKILNQPGITTHMTKLNPKVFIDANS